MRRRITLFAVMMSFLVGILASVNVMADTAITTPTQLYYPQLNTVTGNPQGKVTIVEFFDYNCEYCHRLYGILKDTVAENPNVRLVYRDYPALGPSSQYAAQVALSAVKSGKYLAMHDGFFAVRGLDDTTVARIASENNVPLVKSAISSPVVLQQLKSTAIFANDLGIMGVPVVVVAPTPKKAQKTVNAYMLVSPSKSELEAAIQKASA